MGQNKTADYAWFIGIVAVLLLVYGIVFDAFLLGDGLIGSIVYLWSRSNSQQIVSFMFGLRFKVCYLFTYTYTIFMGDSSM